MTKPARTIGLLTLASFMLASLLVALRLQYYESNLLSLFIKSASLDEIQSAVSIDHGIISQMTPLGECTNLQLETIAKVIDSQESLNVLTRCHDNTWVQDVPPGGNHTHDDGMSGQSLKWQQPILWEIPPEHRTFPPTAISVGCNKGEDAVNTLRMLSKNPKFDKYAWVKAMNYPLQSACKTLDSPQFPLPADIKPGAATPYWRRDDAQMYCIEPMPSTFAHLKRAFNQLKWPSSNFHLANLAMDQTSSQPYILFPNASFVGTSDLGIKDCLGAQDEGFKTTRQATCQKVPLTTLDDFVLENDIVEIDFLSIDTEGNDWPVLLGGMNATLPRVKYLEFEYHEVGQWQQFSLKTVIDTLADHEGGFACYWAGAEGKLWRISGCWRDEYDLWKTWSNVACVSRNKAPTLAARMEERFLQTVSK